MPEQTKEAWPNTELEMALGTKPAPALRTAIHPTREAMSWIRALANDWEDARSHSEAPQVTPSPR
jgi:hypothetical protein